MKSRKEPVMKSRKEIWMCFLFAAILAGCGEDPETTCTQGEKRCEGEQIQTCQQNAWIDGEDCADSGKTCKSGACEDGAAMRLVSISSDGTPGNGDCYGMAISRNGRIIAFMSASDNLVENDTSSQGNIFARDMETGQTTLESVTTSGQAANGPSQWPSLSDDGRYLAFDSFATNLYENDTNERVDIFSRDRQTGKTRLVSASSNETPSNGDSGQPSISGDGSTVVYTSLAYNLTEDEVCTKSGIPVSEVFMTRLSPFDTSLLDLRPTGNGCQNSNEALDISRDGQIVLIRSGVDGLLQGDQDGLNDLFVLDRRNGQLTLVSLGTDGTPANDDIDITAQMTPDGRFVVFLTAANNLVQGDTNGTYDVFVRDLVNKETTMVNLGANSEQANADAYFSGISDDGRFVCFSSDATNLVNGDTNGKVDIFVRDLEQKRTALVSLAPDGTPADDNSYWPVISGDGRYIAFVSEAHNLVESDNKDVADVFIAANPLLR